MTLSEYITSEFGIVPDEVQLEQIKRLVNEELIGKITTAGDIAFLARTQDKRQYAPFDKIINSENSLGTCKERNCTNEAVTDYNGKGHFVCFYHDKKLNDEFDEDYR